MRVKRIIAVLSIVLVLICAGFGFSGISASADVYSDYEDYHVLDIRSWLLENDFGFDDLRVSTSGYPLPEDGSLNIYISDLTININSSSNRVLYRLFNITSNSFVDFIPLVRIDFMKGYLDLCDYTLLVYIPVNLIGDSLENKKFSLSSFMICELISSEYPYGMYFRCQSDFYIGLGTLNTDYVGYVPEDAYRTITSSFQSGYNTGYNNGYTIGFDYGYGEGNSEGYNSGYADGYTDGFQTDVYNMFSPSKGFFISNGTFVILEDSNDNFLIQAQGNSFNDTLFYFYNGWLSIGGTGSSSVNMYLKQGAIYTISFDAMWDSVGLTNNIRIYCLEEGNVSSYTPETTYFVPDDEYTRVVFTFEQYKTGYFRFVIPLSSGSLYIRNIQINEGYNDVYRNSPFDVGYSTGYNDGYMVGKDEGVSSSVTTSWFSSFLAGFSSLFNIQIFPNITLGTIVGVSLLLGFVGFLFRFKGGG